MIKKITFHVGLALLAIAAFVFSSRLFAHNHFTAADPQVAAGEWSISVQVPPCDDPHDLFVNMPERQGDVVTVACREMPVKVK